MAGRATPKFAPARVDVEQLQGGVLILRSPLKLESYAANICSYLVGWAELAPERTFLAERSVTGDWRNVTYSETLASVRALAQALLAHGVREDRPVMLLSDNSIENGLLQLAAMFAGIPVSPVSPAYSLMSRDFGKLKHVFDLVRPKRVYASNGELFNDARMALDLDGELAGLTIREAIEKYPNEITGDANFPAPFPLLPYHRSGPPSPGATRTRRPPR